MRGAMNLSGTKACRKCGYDLAGLGDEGACPECGNAYSVYSGEGVRMTSDTLLAHERGERVKYLFKLWALILMAVGSAGLGVFKSFGATNPRGPLLTGVLFAACFGFAAFVTWWVEKQE